jgi:hypothetical protein
MSLVVGLVDNEQVYMGADSTEVRVPLTLGRQAPIFRMESLLLGFASMSPLASYVLYNLELRQAPSREQLEKFVRSDFVYVLRQYRKDPLSALKPAVQSSGREARERLDRSAQDAQPTRVFLSAPDPQPTKVLLVGAYGRLFTAWSDDRVVEALNGYDAVGIGDSAALGALYSTRGLPAEERVMSALLAAERLTGAVRRPFWVKGPA